MKMSKLTIAGAMVAASLFGANAASEFAKVSAADADRLASTYGGPRTKASLWVWTDKKYLSARSNCDRPLDFEN